MVAYSFQKQFVPPILSGEKRQTIRAHRRRHARPGEMMQLFTGMRTRNCQKITSDPLCIGVDTVRFDLSPMLPVEHEPTCAAELEELAARCSIAVAGRQLEGTEREAFAWEDGFADCVYHGTNNEISVWAAMFAFWMHTYGAAVFVGVVIRWESAR